MAIESERDDGASAVPQAELLSSEVCAALASTFDHPQAVRRALDLALPSLGDWAILDVLTESQEVIRVAVSSVSSEDQETARRLSCRPPVPGDEADPIARVLQAGSSEMIEDVTDAIRARLVSTSWGHDMVERLSPRSWITVPVRARGRTIGALTFLSAGSKRRLGRPHLALAERLAGHIALATDNARLYDEAARAREAKSAFLAVMSHELRTPLTAIIGYTELLADGLFGEMTDQQQLQLGRVRESSERLLSVVNQVLQYARLGARREAARFEDVQIAPMLERLVTAVRPMAERKGLTLAITARPRSTSLRTDPACLQQVLMNLLSNAVKFTEAGEIGLAVREHDDDLTFEVSDAGPGIPAGQLGQIFEPFWQANQRITRSQAGSGLGLSVTRELVDLLGGDIDVSSTVGVGSTFTVRIPRRRAPETPTCRDLDRETS